MSVQQHPITITKQATSKPSSNALDRPSAHSAATSNGVAMPQTQPDNIVNRKGGVESSLFQSCLALKQRLERVPDFEPWLQEMEAEEAEEEENSDPVTSMWNMLRRGQPLLTIYNATGPSTRLKLESSRLAADKFGKQATFMFLSGCMKELQFPASECFIVTDLYGTDTTGFVRVLRVIQRVLDIAQERGYLYEEEKEEFSMNNNKPKTHAENVINEIVVTERDYVQHLETLQMFQTYLVQANVLPGDTLHSIFMNLNQLLDFQRRFLIRVEQQNSLDPSMQNWGQLFHMYQEQFRVYEPFIANQTRCNETVGKEWEKIRVAQLPASFQGMVETQSILLGFLLKPFQRLVKYPMLLEQLEKKGGYDPERKEDLRLGIIATNGILQSANEAVAREARAAAAQDLLVSVDDWKGHKLAEFGELLLFGGQTVLKGDGNKEVEREYKIYLFEKILLCCKDINPNKAKNKLKNMPKGRLRLQLKGRIWMSNITDIMTYSKNNAFYLNIYWRSDPAVENFVIRYGQIEQRDKWNSLIQQQRRAVKGHSPHHHSNTNHAAYGSASHPEYYSMSGTTLVNPYGGEEVEEDDDEIRYTPTTNSMSSNGGLSSSRNASSTSLRSRSATGGSGPLPPSLTGRMPPPRFPMPDAYANGAPLRVQTGFAQGASGSTTPGERELASYFSPTGDSPSSSIRSSQTGMFPFPAQPRSSNNSWAMAEQNNKHMTAPAMGRPSQDGDAQLSRAQRPSLPAIASGSHSHQNLVVRSRSASSPHVQPSGTNRRSDGQYVRTPNDEEPMPPLPAHMAQLRGPINRSQSSSPTETYRNLRGQPQQQAPTLSRNPQTFPNNQYDPSTYHTSRSDPRYQQNHGLIAPTSSGTAPRLTSPGPISDGYQSVQPPTQLRVKVMFDPAPSHVTIVVPNIIRFQSLIDRIDSKMERITASAIAKGSARLKYKDADEDLITIGNDDDVKSAIEEWMEINEAALRQQVVPDFELYWVEAGSARR